MKNDNLIPLQLVCEHYSIEFSFVESLHDCGLLQIAIVDEQQFLIDEQIRHLEKLIMLHFDLDINLEGLEVVDNLLHQVESLQEELRIMRNSLRFYEPD